MNSEKRIIGVVPVGNVPELVPKIVAAHISGYLKLSAEILTPLELPAGAFDEIQLQYDAAKVLRSFEAGPYENYDKVIGVFDVDLFIPTFAYVFGEAKQGGKHALVSLFRLATVKKDTTPLQPSFAKGSQRLPCMNWVISIIFFIAKIRNV